MWYFRLVEPLSSSAIGPRRLELDVRPFHGRLAKRACSRQIHPWISAASICNPCNVAFRHCHAPVRRQRVGRDGTETSLMPKLASTVPLTCPLYFSFPSTRAGSKSRKSPLARHWSDP